MRPSILVTLFTVSIILFLIGMSFSFHQIRVEVWKALLHLDDESRHILEMNRSKLLASQIFSNQRSRSVDLKSPGKTRSFSRPSTSSISPGGPRDDIFKIWDYRDPTTQEREDHRGYSNFIPSIEESASQLEANLSNSNNSSDIERNPVPHPPKWSESTPFPKRLPSQRGSNSPAISPQPFSRPDSVEGERNRVSSGSLSYFFEDRLEFRQLISEDKDRCRFAEVTRSMSCE